MVDVLAAGLDTLECERQVGEALAVRGGDLAAPGVPLRDLRQLVMQDRRLDRVELTVEPDDDVMVLAVLSELAQALHRAIDAVIVGRDGAAVAGRRQVLARMEAPARGRTEAADQPTVDARTDGLCRVF